MDDTFVPPFLPQTYLYVVEKLEAGVETFIYLFFTE